MRAYQLVAFCLSLTTISLAQPVSGGIIVKNLAPFDCYVFVRGSWGHESKHNGPVHWGSSTHFDWGDLSGSKFQVGENCWMVVDVVGGQHGHESGDNFLLANGGYTGTYTLTGWSLQPSWNRLFGNA
ncbi:hypothetical protein F4823DRAFT_565091 [Ustulina deusta]|nr:hypothetical protein F4823DRAFT_565091 [Ustulina deusta]